MEERLSDGVEVNDPILWFQRSLERATQSESFDATRAALATASAQGHPSVRFVLVKQVDARGFAFFTNYESRKARELAANPFAALSFHWASLGEQVRVEGRVVNLPVEESERYFALRPRISQLGAWASEQSAEIADRQALDARLAAVQARFGDAAAVPRPPHWGGLLLVPSSIEFWYERAGRLHDRWLFTRDNATWSVVRLQP
ncbi:MAG TPA: pyridoxamine 5'-phosphate oxidase [Polyangiales bacterium]